MVAQKDFDHCPCFVSLDDPLDPSLTPIPKVGISVFDTDEHGFPAFLLTKPKPRDERESNGMEIVEPDSSEHKSESQSGSQHMSDASPPVSASPNTPAVSGVPSAEKVSQLARTPSPLSASTAESTPQLARPGHAQAATGSEPQSSRKRSRSFDLLSTLPYLKDGDFIEDGNANFLPRPAAWSEYTPVNVATGLWSEHEDNPNFEFAPYSTNPLLRAVCVAPRCVCVKCVLYTCTVRYQHEN